jgi:hypothetical protein
MMKRTSWWRSISAVPADIAPEQDVDREIDSRGCAQDAVKAGVVRRAL